MPLLRAIILEVKRGGTVDFVLRADVPLEDQVAKPGYRSVCFGDQDPDLATIRSGAVIEIRRNTTTKPGKNEKKNQVLNRLQNFIEREWDEFQEEIAESLQLRLFRCRSWDGQQWRNKT